MSIKKFIKSQGATCKNWRARWSFINEEKKVIIFSEEDINTNGNISEIFSDEWKIGENGRKSNAYEESLENIRLIEEEGYELQTYPVTYSNNGKNDIGPVKIKAFKRQLSKKILKRVGGKWYASDGEMGNNLPEEVSSPDQYTEGASKTISVNTYERNANARAKCIAHYGCKCVVCGFDFEKKYGDIGKKYIHVHHITPLAEIRKEYEVDPIKDLIPVCANCHAIIHRTRPALGIDQLKNHLADEKFT